MRQTYRFGNFGNANLLNWPKLFDVAARQK